jgi:sensor histidine kinase YesM
MTAESYVHHDSTMPPLNKKRAWGRMLLIVLLISLGITMTASPNDWNDSARMVAYLVVNFASTFGLWLANGYSVDWLDRYVTWKKQPLLRMVLTVVVSLSASMVVIVIISYGYLVLYRGYGLEVLWTGDAHERYLFSLGITVMISLFLHSRSFLLGWREAAIRAERLEKETAVARLDSLRRQVDPHFLFNSLNALTSLVEENDPARAVRFIRQLSQVYRYVLDSQSQELVPLADELRFAEAYLFLQKTRLEDALAVNLALPPAPELTRFFLPPLALQLLLENAIKHNTALQAEPLQVSVSIDAAAATLSVRNTRRPRRLAPGEASGLGLPNLKARYAFLSSRPVIVHEESTEFVVTLPLLSMNSEQ